MVQLAYSRARPLADSMTLEIVASIAAIYHLVGFCGRYANALCDIYDIFNRRAVLSSTLERVLIEPFSKECNKIYQLMIQ